MIFDIYRHGHARRVYNTITLWTIYALHEGTCSLVKLRR